ncbi:GNAT family N-acetyltransferase [Chryseobacterium sp. MEBOG06]|uniref:GNAT family N-acetyltransferase n=1 Tax=unclassified Chryseobacterium TaxID=2593645 RepID=UPI001F029639|nr:MULTISPECIES: GNAT family N-acetyltransferase [unclassified Chryseobacterium]UKB83089.1 GNAT family N-acetyltransferase [Chryseobacterium sp. MEBOG06]
MSSSTSNNPEIIIRKGNENDLKEMQLLFTHTIDVICRKDYDDMQRKAWSSGTENEERWLSVLKDQYVLVAILNDQLVGFCTLDQGNYIDLLFVHHNHQHEGIASRLYTHIEQKALEQNELYLTADVSKTARPFFKKKGFQIIKEQIVYVKGISLTNYKMTKKLTSSLSE